MITKKSFKNNNSNEYERISSIKKEENHFTKASKNMKEENDFSS